MSTQTHLEKLIEQAEAYEARKLAAFSHTVKTLDFDDIFPETDEDTEAAE